MFPLAIFLGAFLLFQVQPLIAKYILPWFGGGPGVWTSCLLFFQLALLAGYAYAHLITRHLRPRAQAWVHVALLVAAAATLPIIPGDVWKPHSPEHPALRIIILLLVTVGFPYLLLSSTGPLLQRWLSCASPQASPYRLYALSNIGSLLALLSYPVLVEPNLPRRTQAWSWSAGFILFAVVCAGCALRFARTAKVKTILSTSDNQSQKELTSVRPGIPQSLFWFLLPACASMLLLAVTNKICLDLAVIPFLWILPLSLYLITFIIAFDGPRWYSRLLFTLLLIPAMVALCWALFHGTDVAIQKLIAMYCAGLFVCCMVCHGELYRLRPDPAYLTAFYLAIAAGGAAGGAFVALLAPLLFDDYLELHIALFMLGVLFVAICMRDWTPRRGFSIFDSRFSVFNPFSSPVHNPQSTIHNPESSTTWYWLACILPFVGFGGLDWLIAHSGRHLTGHARTYMILARIAMWALLLGGASSWVLRGGHRRFRHWRLITTLWLLFGLATLGTVLWWHASYRDPDIVERRRNFYGILTVYEHQPDDPTAHHLLLQHGGTTHGLQFVDPDQERWPISYYGEQSGIGLAMAAIPDSVRRVGVVGLGTGTLTAYGKLGDYFRIYDINPEIRRIATSRFTYISKCPAQVDVVLGDARLSLEADLPQEFDLIALDAFSGDAIPVHLLTREAFQLYDLNLRSGGVIAVHISNHYLDLEPVVLRLAREFNFKSAVIDFDEESDEWWLYSSTWILLSRNDAIIEDRAIQQAARASKAPKSFPLWTDDFASLYPILK